MQRAPYLTARRGIVCQPGTLASQLEVHHNDGVEAGVELIHATNDSFEHLRGTHCSTPDRRSDFNRRFQGRVADFTSHKYSYGIVPDHRVTKVVLISTILALVDPVNP